MSKKLRIGAFIAFIALCVAIYALFPVAEYLESFIRWVQGIGVWGGVIFGLAYVAAAVLFMPGSAITLAAGFAFGVVWGTVIVSVSSTVGAALAFVIGRFFAQDWVGSKVENYPKFHALYRAIDEEGFKTVLLARLVPVFPFGLLNYGFSVTRVPFWKYVLASWIGMFPATVMYVYFGSAAESLARVLAGEVERTPMQNALFVAGGVAAVLVTVLLTRRARAELDKLTSER